MAAMTRSLLKGSNMPSHMWGEAVRHSVYILNRLPTRALKSSTPYEAWSGKKPNLAHIKVFRCVAFMKIPAVHVKKLDDRSKRVVYLGREPGTKASRLFDPVTGSVQVSRDVVYKEKDFWPWETNSREEVVIPGILTVLEDTVDESFGLTTSDELTTPSHLIGTSNVEGSAERTGEATNSEP